MKKTLLLLALVAALFSCRKEDVYVDDGTYAAEHQDPSIAVDMGEAGKWAPMNIGARKPSEYGYFLAWGEIEPKTVYGWGTYRFGTEGSFIKYSKKDKKTLLSPGDDAATVRWGTAWRMPTVEEWNKLVDTCESVWTSMDGVNGYMLTAPNGHKLFLPVGGIWKDGGVIAPNQGTYWLSECFPGSSSQSGLAFTGGLTELRLFRSSGGGTARCCGLAVRAILAE